MIRQYRYEDKQDWDHYTLNHPDATVFHLTAWKESIESSFGHRSLYLMAEDSGRVVGLLPLFEVRSFLFGHYLVSSPFAELGGVLSDNQEIERLLVQRAAELAEERKCDYLELRNRKEHPGLLTKSLYYNFRREISPDHHENLMAIPRKSRAMVRKGIKSGLVAEIGDHLLPEFYHLLVLNFHRLGTPVFAKRYLAGLLNKRELKATILLVRAPDQKPCAGVLSFFFKDQVLPYYAGSNFTYRSLAPNDFMYWKLMQYGSENGYRIFDYGRSKEGTGSFSFKKNWGFKPEPLAYQYHLVSADGLPDLSPANPKYQKKIEMWQKLPLWATRLMGPKISKYLC
ncbi:MAG: FemAB family XrtA/PEP-CTERM system-associated protein [Desulfurivibrionaceae bacterium]